jgi:hypothetical protein
MPVFGGIDPREAARPEVTTFPAGPSAMALKVLQPGAGGSSPGSMIGLIR